MSDDGDCDICDGPTRLGHVLCDGCAQDRLEDEAANMGWGE